MGEASAHREDQFGTDPRPKSVTRAGVHYLSGWRCRQCDLPQAVPAPSCPDCRGELLESDFGPDGTVWSSTVVHLDMEGLSAPYGLAYIDLDQGPRFLAHAGEQPRSLTVGSRVRISGLNARGDIEVASTESEVTP
jgi:uncharacterized OB-fold protein